MPITRLTEKRRDEMVDESSIEIDQTSFLEQRLAAMALRVNEAAEGTYRKHINSEPAHMTVKSLGQGLIDLGRMHMRQNAAILHQSVLKAHIIKVKECYEQLMRLVDLGVEKDRYGGRKGFTHDQLAMDVWIRPEADIEKREGYINREDQLDQLQGLLLEAKVFHANYSGDKVALWSAMEELDKAVVNFSGFLTKYASDPSSSREKEKGGIDHSAYLEAQTDYADNINQYANGRTRALQELIGRVDQNIKIERSWWRAFAGFFVLPWLLPLAAVVGALVALIGSFVDYQSVKSLGWYWPARLLDVFCWRPSALRRFAQLASQYPVAVDDEGNPVDLKQAEKNEVFLADPAWDDLILNHLIELELELNRFDNEIGGSLVENLESLENARCGCQQIKNTDESFQKRWHCNLDFDGARKARRILNRSTQSGLSRFREQALSLSGEAKNTLLVYQGVWLGRASDQANQQHYKRLRLKVSSALGLKASKQLRCELGEGFDAVLDDQDLDGIDNTQVADTLKAVAKKDMNGLGISFKQKVVAGAATLLAFLYSIGCALMVTAALMGILTFPGGVVVALAIGLVFTYRYNWWLSKFAMPPILLGIFSSKRGLFASLGYAMVSLLWCSVGIAFLPVVWLIVGMPGELFGIGLAKTAYKKFCQFFWLKPADAMPGELQSVIDEEIDSDTLAFAMLMLVALGSWMLFAGIGPFVLGALVIISGVSCFLYKFTKGLTSYTDQQNNRKVMSKSRRVMLAAWASVIVLMSAAMGALVMPSVPGLEKVFELVKIAALALPVAIAAALGTFVAMVALMLVTLAEFLKDPDMMKSLKDFFYKTVWMGGQDARPEKGMSLFLSYLGSGFRCLALLVICALGFWGLSALAFKSMLDLVQQLPILQDGKALITVAIIIGNLSMFATVWVALWDKLVGVVTRPAETWRSFLVFAKNIGDWVYGASLGNSNVAIALKVLFFLPLLVMKAVVLTVFFQLREIFFVVPVYGLIKLAPYFPLTAKRVRNMFVRPTKSAPSAEASEKLNDDNDAKKKQNGAFGWVSETFTRLGNALDNGMLPFAAIQSLFNSSGITILTLVAASLNSYGALEVTKNGQKPLNEIESAVDSQIKRGRCSGAILKQLEVTDIENLNDFNAALNEDELQAMSVDKIANSIGNHSRHNNRQALAALTKAKEKSGDSLSSHFDKQHLLMVKAVAKWASQDESKVDVATVNDVWAKHFASEESVQIEGNDVRKAFTAAAA